MEHQFRSLLRVMLTLYEVGCHEYKYPSGPPVFRVQQLEVVWGRSYMYATFWILPHARYSIL